MSHPRKAVPAAALLISLLALAACRPATQPEETAPPNPLYVDPASVDFSDNPKLLDRLRSTPHGYFRFVNVPFSQEVCRRFSAELAGAPSFNLHGDAHVEQYAVTDRGRGLTDFDDSSIGPAIVDLVRFGVSTALACEQEGCGDEWKSIFDELLRGYRAALEDPTVEAPEPRLVQRKSAKFKHDREGYFGFVESIMEPVPEDETRELTAALEPYFEAMREEHPDLGGGFFAVEELGYLRAGIGSALDLKFLVRLRGASADPLDDPVLEVKQVRDLAGVPCITVAPGQDPLRVLRGHLRIANQPYRYLGYARFRGHNFWVHAWEENYSELEIDEDFAAPAEVTEVAFDVGVQLGRGHAKRLEAPLARQLRREQLELIERDAGKIEASCRELAGLAVAAWERFKREAEP